MVDTIVQQNKKIALKEHQCVTYVEVETITHISCEGYLSTIYTIDNKTTTVSKLLKHFEIELSNLGFIRINRATIVNSKYIAMLRRGNRRKITLVNGVEVAISRRKLYQIRELLQ